MRYSHPSIFSSLSDVPISLKHSKKNSNPILLFQQQTRPTSSIFPILVFFFFFVIVICYKFKSMQNDWEAKNKNREKRIMRNRDGEEVTLWVWVWTIQSHSYYGCCSENHWVWLLFGIAGTTLSLSLSLSLLLSPSSFPLSVPLLESNWNFLYIWDKKRCQLNKYYTNLLFCPFLLNQFGFWKLI